MNQREQQAVDDMLHHSLHREKMMNKTRLFPVGNHNKTMSKRRQPEKANLDLEMM